MRNYYLFQAFLSYFGQNPENYRNFLKTFFKTVYRALSERVFRVVYVLTRIWMPFHAVLRVSFALSPLYSFIVRAKLSETNLSTWNDDIDDIDNIGNDIGNNDEDTNKSKNNNFQHNNINNSNNYDTTTTATNNINDTFTNNNNDNVDNTTNNDKNNSSSNTNNHNNRCYHHYNTKTKTLIYIA